MNQDCWLLEYPWQLEKNKDWSGGVMEHWSGGKEQELECWSIGIEIIKNV